VTPVGAWRRTVPVQVRTALGDVKCAKDVQRMWEEFDCPTVDVLGERHAL